MSRLVPALALAGAALMGTAALAGCGTEKPAAAVGQPAVLSAAEAAEVVAGYDRANNEVNATLNAEALARIEAPPLRTTSEAWLRITKQQARSIPLITSNDPRFIVPSGTGHPRWFVATANRVQGGVPSPRPTYSVFTQQQPGAPWLVAYSLAPMEDAPAPALNGASAATAVTDVADLLVRPENLGQAIFDHYAKDLTGKDDFAKSTALDDQLANGFKVGRNVLRTKGRELTRTVSATELPRYALRTEDGGVLVFTASTVVDVIKASAPGGLVTFEPGTNEAALAGKTGAKAFAITRLHAFLTHIPTKASGAQVKVLAFADAPISISPR
ncbi:hypothetical protein FKR81_20100 [Lentzea tibetensis]|uniref:DUF8094 domain-containing protein n=1 Tax=Lentzea tibetensis TaxID=2591470 RepID=A0A563ES43_9PSEU|nr:hypothetical protein [Lentzea tibetensis]TWP50479.1 hypothetical protein FKR81_20100 [Lentzea tibetensis]